MLKVLKYKKGGYLVDKKQLIEDNINLVYAVIHRHFPTFIRDEDIIQCGRVGLCLAAKSWVEEKGVFASFAWTCILNAIRNELRHRSKTPTTLSLDYPVTDNDGYETSFGEFIVGDNDVDIVDIDRIIEYLNPTGQMVFKLKKLGKTTGEIVSITGYSRETVCKYIRRIKQLLNELQ